MSRVVVVGASIGGVTLAQGLRELGFQGEIVLVEAEHGLPYQRPPLSKSVLLGESATRADLLDEAALLDLGIRLRSGERALGLDPRGRIVHLERGDLAYDHLVIATGAAPVLPEALRPLADDGAHVLRTRRDAVGLAEALDRTTHLLVLGAGVLGSEIASAATSRGVPTTLLARPEQGLGPLRGELAAPLLPLHRAHGVDVRTEPAEISSTPRGWNAAVGHEELGAETLAIAVGARPSIGWLAPALPVGPDGLRCDATGRVAPGVWAVGDVADVAGHRYDVSRSTQAAAVSQARVVAGEIVGIPTARAMPYFWADIHGTRVQAAGRVPPSAEVVTVERDDDGGRVAFAVVEDDVVVGAAAWGSFRGFRRARAMLGAVLQSEEVMR